MDNAKFWMSLEENDAALFYQWQKEEQVDLSSCQISGSKLLHWSAAIGALNVTRALLSEGVSVDLQDADGETPLQAAARAGKVTSINQLVAAGAQLNLKNNSGRTALMIAARHKRAKCVKRLFVLGADASLMDKHGHTVHAYAKTADVLRIIQEHTAQKPAVTVISATPIVEKNYSYRSRLCA